MTFVRSGGTVPPSPPRGATPGFINEYSLSKKNKRKKQQQMFCFCTYFSFQTLQFFGVTVGTKIFFPARRMPKLRHCSVTELMGYINHCFLT